MLAEWQNDLSELPFAKVVTEYTFIEKWNTARNK